MKKISIGYYIIASAIIWGAVMIGCSWKLKGTECYQSINFILYGGVITHLILIWGPLGAQFGKKKKEEINKD